MISFPVINRNLQNAAVVIAIVLLASSAWAAQKYSVIYRFPSTPVTNSLPRSGLTSDAQGNLYGVALGDCLYCSNGEVFEVSPVSGGGWTETILHTFIGTDGSAPTGGLVLDSGGNLYGTTAGGGMYGSGTVFELKKGLGGTFTFLTIHNFDGNVDGQEPYGNLIFDAKGNLYGSTSYGGPVEAQGTVFELSPAAGGIWTESLLHVFEGGLSDGSGPWSGLVLDRAGNLYGTTIAGGQYGGGTVFELTPNGSGGWNGTIIFNFNYQSSTGIEPEASLIFDKAGNLYGTTTNGGGIGVLGNVFELSPISGGSWNETVLYPFPFPTNCGPFCSVDPSSVIFDARGNLWGVTANSGSGCNNTPGCGTVYVLSPETVGTWKYQIFHPFESVRDGSQPLGGLVLHSGSFFGTTSYGGNRRGDGTIFEIIP